MALRLLGPLNKIINTTTNEILEGQLVTKITGAIGTFVTSSIEAIRDITEEDEVEEETEPDTDEGTE